MVEGDILGFEPIKKNVERRRETRVPGEITLLALLISEPDPPEVRIRVINTSRGGCCFNTRRPYRQDEPMAIVFPSTKGNPKLILAVVRHCDSVETGIYNVGVEFLEAISTSEKNITVPDKWASDARIWHTSQAAK